MAYVAPSLLAFKARFPEFAAVDDGLVTAVLSEAIYQVDDSWLERDRARAQMLLAAHTLTVEGEPMRTKTGQGAAGTGMITSRTVGDVSVSFASPSSASGSLGSVYSSTAYGQQYAALMRKNFPSVLAV